MSYVWLWNDDVWDPISVKAGDDIVVLVRRAAKLQTAGRNQITDASSPSASFPPSAASFLSMTFSPVAVLMEVRTD